LKAWTAMQFLLDTERTLTTKSSLFASGFMRSRLRVARGKDKKRTILEYRAA
jgi:hypothetical protein